MAILAFLLVAPAARTLAEGTNLQVNGWKEGLYPVVKENATALYYNNRLWAFLLGPQNAVSATDFILYRQLDSVTNSWGKYNELKDSKGKGIRAAYAVSPILAFDQFLYVFFVEPTAPYGVYYTKYAGPNETGQDTWDPPVAVPGALATSEVAPVYNTETKALEVYYLTQEAIYYSKTTNGLDWTASSRLQTSYMTHATPVALSAAFVQLGTAKTVKTMLATSAANQQIDIFFVDGKDPSSVIHYPLPEANKATARPGLVNLGQGQVILMWKNPNDQIVMHTFREGLGERGTWDETETVWTDKTEWGPTGAVFFQRLDPENLEGYFIVFWGQYHYNTATLTFRKDIQAHIPATPLGWWRRTKVLTTDWAQLPELSDLYPIIGILDAPPYAKNGKTAEDNKTFVEYGNTQTGVTNTTISVKAGVYVETLPNNPLKLEVQSGVYGDTSSAVTLTKGVNYSLRTLDPCQARVLYLAPVIQMTTYEWIDPVTQKPSGEAFYLPNVIDVSILSKPINANTDTNYANLTCLHHTSGELNTYNHVIDNNDILLKNSGTWDDAEASGHMAINLVQGQTTGLGYGGYVSFKIGYQVPGMIGAGASGEFKMYTSTSYTVTDSTKLYLDNPHATNVGDCNLFNATLIWTKADAKWAPQHRQGLGDTPWIITYTVTGIQTNPPALTTAPMFRLASGTDGINQQGYRLTVLNLHQRIIGIESSTNLVQWTPVKNLTNFIGTTSILDPQAAQTPFRFFRAVVQP